MSRWHLERVTVYLFGLRHDTRIVGAPLAGAIITIGFLSEGMSSTAPHQTYSHRRLCSPIPTLNAGIVAPPSGSTCVRSGVRPQDTPSVLTKASRRLIVDERSCEQLAGLFRQHDCLIACGRREHHARAGHCRDENIAAER